jgi:hypothetical protein
MNVPACTITSATMCSAGGASDECQDIGIRPEFFFLLPCDIL